MPIECTLCGSRSLRILFRSRHFREVQGGLPDQNYLSCRDCGLIVLRPLLSESAPGTDYALRVRRLLGLALEPGGLEKLPRFPLAWVGSFVGCGSELVAVVVPAPC